MKEIEVKILEVDPEKIVEKLKAAGAEKIESGVVKVTAYDSPDGSLLKKGSFVRVRTFGHRTELVLKKPIERGEYKVMEEIETNVDDYDATVRLFAALDFKVFAKFEKYRASYKLGDIRYEIDKHPSAPWALEVEAPTGDKVKEGVKLLGYTMDDTTSESAKVIFDRYGLTSFFTFKEHDESPDYDHLFP